MLSNLADEFGHNIPVAVAACVFQQLKVVIGLGLWLEERPGQLLWPRARCDQTHHRYASNSGALSTSKETGPEAWRDGPKTRRRICSHMQPSKRWQRRVVARLLRSNKLVGQAAVRQEARGEKERGRLNQLRPRVGPWDRGEGRE